MDYQKFFLSSKTILASLGVLFVTLAPMLGITFTEADAAEVNTNVNLIGQAADALITAVLALIAVYGRATAKTKLTVVPDPNQTNSPWIVSVALLFFLAACITPNTNGNLSPQAQLFQVESQYAIAKEEVAAYAALPFCSDILIIACSDPATVIKLDEADDTAEEAIVAARLAVQLSDGTDLTSLASATGALRVLLTLVAASALS
jgi:hypothetical protein